MHFRDEPEANLHKPHMSPEFQSLLNAAFASALAPSRRASFLAELIPDFRATADTNQIRQVFSLASLTTSGEQLRVRERRTGDGLALVWIVNGGLTRSRIMWADLADLPIPAEASQATSFIARKRAGLLFERATEAFEDEIGRGAVTLMARRSSPFNDRSLVPSSACSHVAIDDWMKSVGRIAGEPLFDIVVVPTPDEDAAYREKIAAAGRVWTKLLPILIEKLWPGGLPPESRLSKQQFGDELEREIRRLRHEPPDNKTLSRARRDFMGTKLDR
jgi:hypothetical protein